MIKLNRIYTRTGDTGETGLVRGPRRSKTDLRVTAYGTVEEANASIGLARLHATGHEEIDQTLGRIQNDLFDVGSDLATPGSDEGAEFPALRVTDAQVAWLEAKIDDATARLEPLGSFILPGGTPLAAALHMARTVVRRAERDTVSLMQVEPETTRLPQVYLNRLSDLVFVLGRLANDEGRADILWEPGRHSGSSKG